MASAAPLSPRRSTVHAAAEVDCKQRRRRHGPARGRKKVDYASTRASHQSKRHTHPRKGTTYSTTSTKPIGGSGGTQLCYSGQAVGSKRYVAGSLVLESYVGNYTHVTR
ncbi:hypothetical protein OPV22_015831 [Ensete ventricosum]|uniref:Uncharacterized protein n=1 Tax=Ensete ventricosum TaxID=4639 RepID=A0AAV8RE01_ENSVE|nr:hypothetical protein OPV22_015831 [Ensete ventricosum]